MDHAIDIMVVDDEALVRLGVKFSLMNLAPDIHIVAEAGDVASAKTLIESDMHIDVALLDIILPDGTGLELAKLIREKRQTTKILVVSIESSEEVVKGLLDVGIDGFISKQADDRELVAAIHAVADGFEYYGADVAKLIHAVQTSLHWKESDFTEREMEILKLCAQGLSAKQIGEKLFLSHRTIEFHKQNIFQKMGFKSTTELVHYAFKHGLVKL